MDNINASNWDGVPCHHNYADFDAAWEGCLRPWFEAEVARGWECPQLAVVTCPTPALVAALKQRVVEAGLSATGIHFTTPGSLRKLLSAHIQGAGGRTGMVLREDLHLIVRSLAEALPDNAVAHAVVRDPASLVSALDALDAGAWEAKELEDETARLLGRQLGDVLRRGGLATVRQADRDLDVQAEGRSGVLGAWLAIGFSSSDWGLFPLLSAGLKTSSRSTFCFLAENERADTAAWAGTWEELAGPLSEHWAAEPELARPYDGLASRFLGHERGEEGGIEFILTKTPEAEVGGILHAIAGAVRDYPGGRIAVVLPRSTSLLGRELALKLAEHGLPHHDQPGHRPARDPRHGLFNAWLVYQKEQKLTAYLDFLRELARAGRLPRGQEQDYERCWRRAFQEMMTEDMAVLATWLEQLDDSGPTLELYRSWPGLASPLTLEEALVALEGPMNRLGWPESSSAFRERASQLARGVGALAMSREALLDWVAGVVDIPGRTRAGCGREPFAPVQLVTLSEAAGQHWDVVILAGMNHGDWPADRTESPFLPENTLRLLNGRSLTTGSQGEGHTVVRRPHTLMPSGSDDAARAEERLLALLESTRGRLCASVSLRDPVDSSAPRAVSEWFLRLYAADRAQWLDDKTLAGLAQEGEARYLPPVAGGSFSVIGEVDKRRRDAEAGFDGYSFAYEEPPQGGLSLSASAWERVLAQPAGTWYRTILHVAASLPPSEEDPWHLAYGTWVHSWVRPGEQTRTWLKLPSGEAWLALLDQRACAVRAMAEKAFAGAGRVLPDWWLAGWAKSRRQARDFVRAILAADTLSYAASELPLPDGTQVLAEGLEALPLRGRMDLVLADRPHDLEQVAEGSGMLEVIDFKTGNRNKLSLDRLGKGDGVQIALYALALRSLTGIDAQAALMAAGIAYEPQLSATEVEEAVELWRTVNAIFQSGRLGDYGALRPEHGFGEPRPMADLPISPAILAAKWNLTHPDFPVK